MSFFRFIYQARSLNRPLIRPMQNNNINHWIIPIFIYCNYTGYEMIKYNKK